MLIHNKKQENACFKIRQLTATVTITQTETVASKRQLILSKSMKHTLLFLLLLINGAITTIAQTGAINNTPVSKFPDFFIGSWTGEGEFASGKKINATLTFTLSLDSSWLMVEHTDKAPNRYKATSMWGTDAGTGQFLAYTFDNFHGHRQFTSDGWKNGKLLLTTNEYYAKSGLVFQHFVYEQLSDKSFKMTYEVSKDAITWKLGDYLIFTRS